MARSAHNSVRFEYLVRCRNRNVCPRQEHPLFLRTFVDREVDEVTADSAEIEKRIALGRSPVADDFLARMFEVDQKSQQIELCLVHLF